MLTSYLYSRQLISLFDTVCYIRGIFNLHRIADGNQRNRKNQIKELQNRLNRMTQKRVDVFLHCIWSNKCCGCAVLLDAYFPLRARAHLANDRTNDISAHAMSAAHGKKPRPPASPAPTLTSQRAAVERKCKSYLLDLDIYALSLTILKRT